MKKSTYLLLCSLFLFLACNRPMKLLDKGESKKALKASMNRLKHGKIKSDHLYVFEKSFLELTENDAQWVATMRKNGNPAVWLDIYKKAKAIEKRQRKVNKINNRLQGKGHYPSINPYPVSALIEEARDNVALYYYAKSQELVPLARSNNRKAAREAYKWIQEAQKYRPDFKDTPSLASEMYALGTTHILLNPIEGNPFHDHRLYQAFFRNEHFPKRLDWEVVHIDRPLDEAIDFRMDLLFDEVYVSWDKETFNTCSNTTKVQDGYEDVSVWCTRDSTYVIERRPIYIEVSVVVKNYVQQKHADLGIRANLIDEATEEQVDYFRLSHKESWRNRYGKLNGDRRALENKCKVWTGCRQFFPSDQALLLDAARALDHRFYRVLECEFDL